MAAPKAGEMRCTSCGRSTPVAPFCTHCGAPLPEGAPARPRGLDRDELEEKARERRTGGPFRRGEYIAGPVGPAGYERFMPEPEDRLARTEAPDAEERIDRFAEHEARVARPVVAERLVAEPPIEPAAEEPPVATPPWREPVVPLTSPPEWQEPLRPPEERQAAYDDEREQAELPPAYAAEAYPYAYPGSEPAEEERRGGVGPLILAAFAAVGVLAVLGGALLAGVFAPGAPLAESTPTPAPAVTATPPSAETPAPTAAPTQPGASPGASPGTIGPSDGFTAEAIPCAAEPEPDGQGGGMCPEDGSTISSGDRVWVLVNFTDVEKGDVIALQITDPAGSEHDEGSWEATGSGRGWAYFSVVSSRTQEGVYQALITRNGQPAAETSFTVEG